MRRTLVTAAVSAALCAALLAGCQSAPAAGHPVNGAPVGVGTPTGSANPGTAGDDVSDLNTVDQQLGTLDSALAKATQSAPDGD